MDVLIVEIMTENSNEDLMWLSFADEDTGEFNGVVIIHAEEIIEAFKLTRMLGINPGGQVVGFPIPKNLEHCIPPQMIGRILNKYESQCLANIIDSEHAKYLIQNRRSNHDRMH